MSRSGPTFEVLTNFHFSLPCLNLVTKPIVLEFLGSAGIGWCYLQPWFRLASRTPCLHLLGLSVCLFVWYVYGGIGTFHGPTRWGWALALVVLALALASKTITLAPSAWLVWIGTISYSLYLTHTTVQLLVGWGVEAAGSSRHAWTYVLLSTAVALSVAALAHHYLEEKLSHAVRRGLLRLFRRWLAPQDAGDAAPAVGSRSATEA